MIQATVAIADFMMILIHAALWAAAAAAAWIVTGLVALGGLVYLARRRRARKRARR